MRDNLNELINKTISIEFQLPYKEINKVSISKDNDYCLKTISDNEIAQVIYNSIIDYCLNESEIDITTLNEMQLYAIGNRLRFDENASPTTQLKYGFYGETLLNIVLNFFFETKKVIAKGYFYSPIEDSEPKGYDCFHFLNNKDNQIELWFGEAKMYSSLNEAIKSVLKNINRSLEIKYFNKNVRAILGRTNDIDETDMSNYIRDLNYRLKKENINLWKEITKSNIKVVYPIFISYDGKLDDYEKNIEESIFTIENEISKNNFQNEISANILFILLPLDKVKYVKEEVIKCICQKKSII